MIERRTKVRVVRCISESLVGKIGVVIRFDEWGYLIDFDGIPIGGFLEGDLEVIK